LDFGQRGRGECPKSKTPYSFLLNVKIHIFLIKYKIIKVNPKIIILFSQTKEIKLLRNKRSGPEIAILITEIIREEI